MATQRSASPGHGSEIAVAVMLPPSIPNLHSQPSIAGSLGKRKRGQESAAGSVGAVTSASYGFAPSVKEKVERFNAGFQCWHCSAPKSHICHVIGRRERVLFQELQSQGRLGIQHPDQAENAIPLCPLCHDALDEISSPGWVFIPTDLQYFTDFERQDYKRRREMLDTTGDYTVRVSPTPGQYLQHQSEEVGEDAHGGLYACYVLRHYVGRLPGSAEMRPGLSPYTEPKTWHGDPMTALSKAFKAVGMTPLAFPVEMRDKLMELSILYGTNDQLLKQQPRPPSAIDLEDGSGSSPCNRTNREAEPLSKTSARRHRARTRQRTSSSPRRQGTLGGQHADSRTHKRKRFPEEAHKDVNVPPSDVGDRRKRHVPKSHWKWGPGATSEMAMDFYDSIYHLPQKEMGTTAELKERSDRAPRKSLLPSPNSSENDESVEHPFQPTISYSPNLSLFPPTSQSEKPCNQCIGAVE